MDEELKHYRKRLEVAINEALAESASINAIIQEIQASGYEVFLIIEATVGFNRADAPSAPAEMSESSRVRLKLTSQDERFLRQLKISPE